MVSSKGTGKVLALLCCLAYFNLIGQIVLSKPFGDGQLPSLSLKQLTEMISQGVKPNVELVFDAYREYVRLHEIQSNPGLLVGNSIGDENLIGTTNNLYENEDEIRAKINEILNEPLVRIVSENLFSLLPDDNTDGIVEKTDRLKRSITRAINGLGL